MKRYEIIEEYVKICNKHKTLMEEERFSYKYSDIYVNQLREDLEHTMIRMNDLIEAYDIQDYEIEAFPIFVYARKPEQTEMIFDAAIFYGIAGYFSDKDLSFKAVMTAVRWAREKNISEFYDEVEELEEVEEDEEA